MNKKPQSTVPLEVTGPDLKEYLQSQDDFAFELDIYRECCSLGFETKHAGTYEDPSTYKPRQFDICASREIAGCFVHLAIECKRLAQDFPLLISRVPRPVEDGFHDLIFTSSFPAVGGHARIARYSGSPIYPYSENVGKSMRQVKRDINKGVVGGDEVFDKWMQAVASAGELIAYAVQYHRANRPTVHRSVVLPILVVSNDCLWAADYAGDGRLIDDPKLIPYSTFFIGRRFKLEVIQATYTVSHLHIHTCSSAKQFLGEVSRPGPFWENLFSGLDLT